MRFAHISDLHLCVDPAANPSVKDDTLEIAERLAGDLRGLSACLDGVIVSGDLTDDADPRSFAQFERLFAPLGLPVFIIPGNHDGPTGYFAHKRGSGFFQQADITGRRVDLAGIRFVGINSCIEATTTGGMADETFGLLETELAARSASPLVIVMHHPPFAPGQRDYDEISVLQGVERFERLLQQSGASPTILCGHVHRPYFAAWNGANCFIAGSPARTFAADPPFGDAPIRPLDEPFSYFIHQLDGSGGHVMTSRWLTPS